MPRSLQISIEKLVELYQKYEEILFQGDNIPGPTHQVWPDIATDANNKITGRFAYTIINCNRHNVREKLRSGHESNVNSDRRNESSPESEFDQHFEDELFHF